MNTESKKLYYGFRYYSGHSTTTGEPNPKTGRLSIAGETRVFSNREKLNAWLDKEKLTSPCGLGGGRREEKTLKELRKLYLGFSQENFDEIMEMENFDIDPEE
jgi:hypothetical protein